MDFGLAGVEREGIGVPSANPALDKLGQGTHSQIESRRFSLREIAALRNTPVSHGAEPLTVTLARQRATLSERRDGLDRVLQAIEHAQRRAQEPRGTRVASLPDHPEGDTNARSYRLESEVLQSGGL